jgi:Zn-dependent protease with chaperone function
MTYWLLASIVTLSAFTVALATASAIAAAAMPALSRRAAQWTPSPRAAAFFSLRIGPAFAALAFAVLLVLPTFLYYEPFDTDEPLRLTLAISALAGFAIIGSGVIRAWRAWRATATLSKTWSEAGHRITDVDAPVPVFAVRHSFPTAAVVGWRRPILYLSEDVLRQCEAAEIRAIVAHECAHIRAHDNLRRLLLRACPPMPFARRLERSWQTAAEQAADAAAASCGAGRLDLAQALMTSARLASNARVELPTSAFFEGGTFESRVRLLLHPVEPAPVSAWPSWIVPAATALSGAAFVYVAPVIHQGMESLIRLLP